MNDRVYTFLVVAWFLSCGMGIWLHVGGLRLALKDVRNLHANDQNGVRLRVAKGEVASETGRLISKAMMFAFGVVGVTAPHDQPVTAQSIISIVLLFGGVWVLNVIAIHARLNMEKLRGLLRAEGYDALQPPDAYKPDDSGEE